jgi:hypothetical protein
MNFITPILIGRSHKLLECPNITLFLCQLLRYKLLCFVSVSSTVSLSAFGLLLLILLLELSAQVFSA